MAGRGQISLIALASGGAIWLEERDRSSNGDIRQWRMPSAVELIRSVRDGNDIANNDLRHFISGVCDGSVPDYQTAAFLMAVYFQSLSAATTAELTLAMRDSGKCFTFSDLPTADKHSTGGIGDKISIALAPLAAACGVYVPMISGRGLGHTGGTLDKLESIPGFSIHVPDFERQVREIGVAIIGQTDDLVPADKKLYSLRDVTATVESVPLVASSILSKKMAAGTRTLVIDLKVGRGAFMKTREEAEELATSMRQIAAHSPNFDLEVLFTSMDDPIGIAIGNSLEVQEAIDVLHNKGPRDTTELVVELSSRMVRLAGLAETYELARALVLERLHSGAAARKFEQLVEAQGGSLKAPLPLAPFVTTVYADQASGFVKAIDSFELGLVTIALGGGRLKATDKIDPGVGIRIIASPGMAARDGLVKVYHREPHLDETIQLRLRRSFAISPIGVPRPVSRLL